MQKAAPRRASARVTEAARERVLAAASRLFAEHGFEVSLAQIGREARVPPAVLRRCARSKRALIEQVIARLFEGRWKAEWDALLANRALPLDERLARFYTEYRGNIDRTGARLWTRVGLMGVHASGKFSGKLAERILMPVVRELRREAGLGGTDRPVTGREIELVQMLHGSIAFPHTRSHIFGMEVRGRLAELIAMMVRVWLLGAIAEVRRLNPR